jgi:O-antigen ligase
VATITLVLAFLVTTLVAYFKFGDRLFLDELVALLRFATQTSVVILLAFSLVGKKQVSMAETVIDGLGYIITASVYATTVFFVVGIRIGEIHSTGAILRAFGPLGDQVGFVLLFFVIRQWILGNIIRSFFVVGAVLSTGTRGALLALGVALLALWWKRDKIGQRSPSILLSSFSFVVICLGIVTLDVGGIRSRAIVEESHHFNSFLQRLQTGSVAVNVIQDNPFFGVGFSGFRLIARDYGADTAFSQFWSPSFVATAGNQYLQILTDGGVVGFIALIALIFLSLRTYEEGMYFSDDKGKHFMAAGYIWLLALTLGNQSAAWLLPGSLISYFLWLTLAMAIAVNWIAKMEHNSFQPNISMANASAVLAGE